MWFNISRKFFLIFLVFFIFIFSISSEKSYLKKIIYFIFNLQFYLEISFFLFSHRMDLVFDHFHYYYLLVNVSLHYSHSLDLMVLKSNLLEKMLNHLMVNVFLIIEKDLSIFYPMRKLVFILSPYC